jgi:hypothetical protein
MPSKTAGHDHMRASVEVTESYSRDGRHKGEHSTEARVNSRQLCSRVAYLLPPLGTCAQPGAALSAPGLSVCACQAHADDGNTEGTSYT